MSVYVDAAEHRFRGLVMCHMIAETVAELHEFAAKIGMKREWFQPMSRPHYDLSETLRAKAVAAGAIEVDRRGIAAVMKRQLPVWAEEYRIARENGKPHP